MTTMIRRTEEDINNTTTNSTTYSELDNLLNSSEILPSRDTYYQQYSFGTSTTVYISYYKQMTKMNPSRQGIE